MMTGIGIRPVIAAVIALVVAGCCDKAAVERCRAEAAEQQKLLALPAITAANGAMRFEVHAAADVTLSATVVQSTCQGGKAGAAEVKLTWDVARSGMAGVRVRVGANDAVGKVWMEAGTKGEGVTGPWIADGSLLVLSDVFNDTTLAEIRVIGLPCGAESAP